MSDPTTVLILPETLRGMKPVYHPSTTCTHLTDNHAPVPLSEIDESIVACQHCPDDDSPAPPRTIRKSLRRRLNDGDISHGTPSIHE